MPSQREIKRAEAHELVDAWLDAEVTVTGDERDLLTQKEAVGLLDAWLWATCHRERPTGSTGTVRRVLTERLVEEGARLHPRSHLLIGVKVHLSWVPGADGPVPVL